MKTGKSHFDPNSSALGLGPEEAATLAVRTIDWRDSDDHAQPRGAEAADYAAAGLLSPPRNDPFVSLDEVGTVIGLPTYIGAQLPERFVVMRALPPTGAHNASAPNAAGMDRQIPTTPSDGLTRSTDVAARGFYVEVSMGWESERIKRAYLGELQN